MKGFRFAVAISCSFAAFLWVKFSERLRSKKKLRVHVLQGQKFGGVLSPPSFSEDDILHIRSVLDVEISSGFDAPSGTEVLVGAAPLAADIDSILETLRAIIVPFAGLPPGLSNLVQSKPEYANLSIHNIHHNDYLAAEMAVALCLAAAKLIVPADRMLRRGDWSARGVPSEGPPSPMPLAVLGGGTCLVVGYGRIGRRVAAAMEGLGMAVLATRASAPAGRSPRRDGPAEVYPAAALDTLLPRARVVFVCAPATPATAGMLGRARLALLPPAAILVNVSRGDVIEEEALFEALSEGRLFAAGIDVWYNYPASAKERTCTPVSKRFDFASLDNVVMSPHRGGAVGCAEGERARREALVELLRPAAAGGVGRLGNRVDPRRGY